jgi:hypothetical protein
MISSEVLIQSENHVSILFDEEDLCKNKRELKKFTDQYFIEKIMNLPNMVQSLSFSSKLKQKQTQEMK